MIDSYNMYWLVLFNVLPYGVFHVGVLLHSSCTTSKSFLNSIATPPLLLSPQLVVCDDVIVALFEFGLVEPGFVLLILHSRSVSTAISIFWLLVQTLLYDPSSLLILH